MPLVILEVWCGPAPLGRSPPAATRCSGMVHRWWSAGSVCWVRCRAAGRGSRRGWWCRNPGVVGDALGQGQQPAQTPGHRVFAQGWVSEAAEFLQRGMAVVQPQGADRHQVIRSTVAEDVHRLLNPGGAGRGGGRGVPASCPDFRGRPSGSAVPRWRLRPGPGRHQGQQCPDGVFVPDQDAVRAANVPGFRGDPNRRAAPIRASAVSGPGQCTSKAGERSGSVSEPAPP